MPSLPFLDTKTISLTQGGEEQTQFSKKIRNKGDMSDIFVPCIIFDVPDDLIKRQMMFYKMKISVTTMTHS